MTDVESNQQTPSRPATYRIGRLNSFIPLNDDSASAWSTRGQRLPGLLQSRSSTTLFRPPGGITRRRSSFHSTHSAEDNSDDATMHTPPKGMRRVQTSYFSGTDYNTDMRVDADREHDPRRDSINPSVFNTPQMRSMRLIGKSNPRYRWGQYWKTDEELKKMKKNVRAYYERCNFLVSSYVYIDRLLDSSLPHDLMAEYGKKEGGGKGGEAGETEGLGMIREEEGAQQEQQGNGSALSGGHGSADFGKLKRTPRNLYKLPEAGSETTPLLGNTGTEVEVDEDEGDLVEMPEDMKLDDGDDGEDSGSRVVTVAIYINLVANVFLLAGKLAVILLTSSLSVLASLVDAALDFLSTAIVWSTTKLISHNDQYAYPIGRRRLEPVGVLVFSVIMITSFFQVSLECVNRLMSPNHEIVQLTLPAILIMLSTVLIKGFCYFWCRLVKNSSVQALAQDALTDIVFNTFSIIFPLVGFWLKIWYLDALGGLLLSLYVMIQWSRTSATHVRNLCGAAANRDQRNILLYLTMRFAKTIRKIQGLQAYHTGDKLNVEVDIVLEENMKLRDSHDLSESLQYVLESVPYVDRAFVHADYAEYNLASHMDQQAA